MIMEKIELFDKEINVNTTIKCHLEFIFSFGSIESHEYLKKNTVLSVICVDYLV